MTTVGSPFALAVAMVVAVVTMRPAAALAAAVRRGVDVGGRRAARHFS